MDWVNFLAAGRSHTRRCSTKRVDYHMELDDVAFDVNL